MTKRHLAGSRRLVTALLTVVVVLAVACGSDDDTATDGTTSTTSTTTTSDAPTTSEDATTSTSSTTSTDTTTTTTTTTTSTSTTTTTTASTTTLPGEPFDLFIEEGDVLGVVGVNFADVLNIRILPGTDQEIVATADPLEDGLIATGRERRLTRSIWYEVTLDGTTGWASSSFLAYIGGVDDATSAFLDGDPLPSAESMEELGQLVAAGFASEDPRSRIEQSVEASAGDLGEVTFDVIGLGDDAVFGLRLHVFGTPDADGFSLKTIERTTLCGRGVTDEGLCV